MAAKLCTKQQLFNAYLIQMYEVVIDHSILPEILSNLNYPLSLTIFEYVTDTSIYNMFFIFTFYDAEFQYYKL